ncbi:MAG: phosphate ABC transporter substrate-binding protein PstS [Lentisphaerae bacterium GWF2_52_8]|nr:MAG: phosphate ABC transporter substrate-binding protein PstS [Lentisphaerae bacterium GWF2_52_8]
MKKLFGLSLGLAAGLGAISGLAAETLNGAGATFPAPVYNKWTYNYGQSCGTKINYQSIGSGAGIAQIKAKTVNFGASDEPLAKEEMDKFGLMQFPMLIGGVVPVVNLPGVEPGKLKLSGKLLADIFLGKISKWDDPAIKELNPELKLPSFPVAVVHRSDSSGTTWIFTNYLGKVSEEWAKGPGNGKDVKWPCGVGGQKNPGVANNVLKMAGAIGYVEYTYAVEAKMNCVNLQNKDGKFVAPALENFAASAANADWQNTPGFFMVLTEQPGEKTWPISGVTYILIYKEQASAATAKEMIKYFSWCYTEGAKLASELNYVPLPENVVKMVKDEWKKSLKAEGKQLVE